MRLRKMAYPAFLLTLLLLSGGMTYALACDSGGPGAVGCSTDECSVTCAVGFACCEERFFFSDTCKCKIIRINNPIPQAPPIS